MADLTTEEIVTSTRLKLSDTAFDQSMIIDAMNFFISELYHNTRTRRMETSDVISVGANDTTADLPDDIDIILDLTVVVPTTHIFDLLKHRMEYADFMKIYPAWATAPPQAIQDWTDFGNAMRFSAPALTATTINIDYLRVPTLSALIPDGTTPTDTIELDEGYKELATLGTLARCMESNEDYAEAQSERANLAPLVTAWIRNEGRGGIKAGPTIIRSNRRSSRYSRDRYW